MEYKSDHEAGDVYTCNPSTQEVETGGPRVQGQPHTFGLQSQPGLYNTLSKNTLKIKKKIQNSLHRQVTFLGGLTSILSSRAAQKENAQGIPEW